ncbi:MAG: lipocalin-like domain-containing protein [Tannerellaceae bacterium]|jgi:hypothetical protein|nr:lipocalin-like domain-containing protein [Tannerellaceae bacterium]
MTRLEKQTKNMSKQIKGCIGLLLLFASCSTDIGDRLEGKWQLQQVEANGVTEKVDTVFYNFQTSLFMYQVYRPERDIFSSCFGFRMMETKDQLLLELTGYSSAIQNFLLLTDWESSDRRFIVKEVTDKRLVLNSDDKSYTFRKF